MEKRPYMSDNDIEETIIPEININNHELLSYLNFTKGV